MPVVIRNKSVEPLTLPPPLRGILAGGQGITIDATAQQVLAAIPGIGLVCEVRDLPHSSAIDAAYDGGVARIGRAMLATQETTTFYVAENGSDDNPGTAARPLATVQGALDRIPMRIDHLTRIRLQPRTSGRYLIPPMTDYQVNANLIIEGDGITELLSTTAGAGSDAAQVVGSFTLNEYRGKTIEILTGAAAGDRRTIRDNTTTAIVPCNPFNAAVADGDSYRIHEPAVDCEIDSSLGPLLRNVAPLVGVFPTSQETGNPLIYWVNINVDPIQAIGVPLLIDHSSIAMIGVELEGQGFGQNGFASTNYSGYMFMGVDAGGRVNIGYDVYNAPAPESWYGWGVASPIAGDFSIWRRINVHGIYVADRMPCYGIRGFITGGNLFTGGVRLFGGEENLGTRITFRGNDSNNIDLLINGTTWGIDIGGNATSEMEVILANCGIYATTGPAIKVFGPAYVLVRDNDSNVESTSGPAIRAELGARVELWNGFTISAGTNELEIGDGNGGIATSGTFASLLNPGSHLTHTDGTIFQRVA